MKLTNFLLCLLILACCFGTSAQMQDYTYSRALDGVSEQWHLLRLPDDIFGKVSPGMADIRIIGINEEGDTLEVPYLIRTTAEKIVDKEVPFALLNQSYNKQGYYFTFEIASSEPVNQITLDFRQKNFDWKIRLEGSQDQQEWFGIIDNYRILSFQNESTEFQFTRLLFPRSRYRYYRLFVPGQEKPELISASSRQHEIIGGEFQHYPARITHTQEKKEARQTETELSLPTPIPVYSIRISIRDTFDYYRPVTIKYLRDSVLTPQGWKYNYSLLRSGILKSGKRNEFITDSRFIQKLRIQIHNQDNQPLTIDSVHVSGYIYELVARFPEQADYFLVYGNRAASAPQYDLSHFAERIPDSLTVIKPGTEQRIRDEEANTAQPLFANSIWLWVIMILIIAVLGTFAIKMLRN